MKERIWAFTHNRKVVSYFVIFCVSLLICIPLFSKNMNITIDDGIQHISRLIGTSASIKEGNLFSCIMPEFCNGFGYSWNLFYSPLTAYLPLLFNLITSSYIVCLKLFLFATMFFSGVFMFQFVRTISKSYVAAVISSILYMTAPYHLTDLYSRVAVAELATFVFLPMVFLGVHQLLNQNYKKTYYIALGAIGLILSHNVITLYTAIFCVIYLVSHMKQLKNKETIKHLLINTGIILLTVSFFILPLLEHYFATTYEVFVEGRMFNINTLISSKLGIWDLLIAKKYNMIFHIGIPVIIGIIFFFLFRNRITKKYRKTVTIFLVFGLVSIFMSTKLFPFEILPASLKMLQFQWRMLEFSSFFLSIVAGIMITTYIHHKKNKKNTVVELIILLYTIILLLSINPLIQIPIKEETLINPIPVETSTSQLHPNTATFEYLPQKAYQNMDYIMYRNQEVKVLLGEANILEEVKKGTNLEFSLEQVTTNTKLELPYIYYLGYEANLIREDGSKITLTISESDKGFIQITVPEIQKGKIEVSYQGTNLMKLSYMLTILGIILLISYIYYYRHPRKIIHSRENKF